MKHKNWSHKRQKMKEAIPNKQLYSHDIKTGNFDHVGVWISEPVKSLFHSILRTTKVIKYLEWKKWVYNW